MVVNMHKHHKTCMRKVAIKILQGSVVTQSVLDGLTIHPPVANVLQCITVHCMCQKLWKLVGN